jgi:hypothetical protein
MRDRAQLEGCASSVACMPCSAAWGTFVIALILPFRTVGVYSSRNGHGTNQPRQQRRLHNDVRVSPRIGAMYGMAH